MLNLPHLKGSHELGDIFGMTAFPVAQVFALGNLIIGTFLRMAFGGKVTFRM